MEVNPWILLQELLYQTGFVSGEIVQDDVNLLVAGAQSDDFLEEGDEFVAGVASRGFAVTRPVAVSKAAYKERVPWR